MKSPQHFKKLFIRKVNVNISNILALPIETSLSIGAKLSKYFLKAAPRFKKFN